MFRHATRPTSFSFTVVAALSLAACRTGICEREEESGRFDFCEVHVDKGACESRKGKFSTAPDDARAAVFCAAKGFREDDLKNEGSRYKLFTRDRLGQPR